MRGTLILLGAPAPRMDQMDSYQGSRKPVNCTPPEANNCYCKMTSYPRRIHLELKKIPLKLASFRFWSLWSPDATE